MWGRIRGEERGSHGGRGGGRQAGILGQVLLQAILYFEETRSRHSVPLVAAHLQNGAQDAWIIVHLHRNFCLSAIKEKREGKLFHTWHLI